MEQGETVSLFRRALSASIRPRHLIPPALGIAASVSLLLVDLVPFAFATALLSFVAWATLVTRELLSSSPQAIAESTPTLESVQLARAHRAILSAADRVRTSARSHDGALSDSLGDVVIHCDELVVASAAMAARGDALFRFLRVHDPSELRRMADEHTRAARSMKDAEVAGSLRSAAEAKRRQLETIEELRTLYDRILAELLAVEATLGELHARVVKLTFEDPAYALSVAGTVGGELSSVRQRVQRLERSAAATLRELSG